MLLLVPKHALLAFYTGDKKGDPIFVETTLLGARQLAVRPKPGFVGELSLIDEAMHSTSFSAALVAGKARYARVAAGFVCANPTISGSIWLPRARTASFRSPRPIRRRPPPLPR